MARPTTVVTRKNLAVSAAGCALLIFWGPRAGLHDARHQLPASSNQVLLDKGYREMYNLEFIAAHTAFADYERANPASAMGPVSDAAAYLFTELDRLNILRSGLPDERRKLFHGE